MNTLEQAPEWHKFLAKHIVGGRDRVLIDHLADIAEADRKYATGAYIVPGSLFTITSDGFAMINFVDPEGNYHHGAFWGDWSPTIKRILLYRQFIADRADPDAAKQMSVELINAVERWTGRDYRAKQAES